MSKLTLTNFRKKIIFLSALIMMAVIAAMVYMVGPKSDTTPTKQNHGTNNGLTTESDNSIVPLEFEEMTIPFLRERAYTSSLSELEQIRNAGQYTSYLTNYQSDGLRINGLLTKPTGQIPEGGWPAIVFIHGYIAPAQYKTQEKYVEYVDYLARNGFVVFKIDLRGHGDSEGEAGGAYYSSDYVIDTLNARAALSSVDFINSNKIGLWGHSMAGNVTLRSLAAKPDIPAVVVWAGAVFSYNDFGQFGINDNSYRSPSVSSNRQRRRQELFDTHGQFDPQSLFWQQVDPTNYLKDIIGGVQLHHAVNDTVVDIEYSRNLNLLLDQTQVLHEFYEYSDGGHNISGANFNLAMQRTVDFFNQQLK
jgi:dipeptidyl aminopeptidase/acylaminoacyl peptidase